MTKIRPKKVFTPEKKTPIRVAFFSNGPNLPTGYAKVIREIVLRLRMDTDFEVVIINENYYGPPTDFMGIPMYGLDVPMVSDGRGMQPVREASAEAFAKLIQQITPDVVIFLEDSFTLQNFGFEGLIKTPCKRIFYMPLDGDWIPETGINVTRTMDKIVAMSKFTQNTLAKEGFDSDMIWHGVDIETFHPVTKEYQTELKLRHGFKADDVIFFNYGRNSNIRKNNQGLLWIMAKYLSTAPENHKFLMHTLEPDFPGNSLFDYVNRHLKMEFGEDVIKRIIFTPFRQNNPANDNQVAMMIQMSDVVVTASTGEGFGLIMSEAMACAKPVVSNEYTTPIELLDDTSMGIDERGWVVPSATAFVASLNTEHAYVDKMEFVNTLKKVIHDKNEMAKRGANGRIFAEKYLNWDYLVDEWKRVIKEVM